VGRLRAGAAPAGAEPGRPCMFQHRKQNLTRAPPVLLLPVQVYQRPGAFGTAGRAAGDRCARAPPNSRLREAWCLQRSTAR
jgi:hypothetical protein